MGDVFVIVAGPGDVLLSCGKGCADGVQAFDVLRVPVALFRGFAGDLILKAFQDVATHVRHDAHVHHHVGAVCELHADLGKRRIRRPHAERDHIHHAAFHRAGEFFREEVPHFHGIRPFVGGAGFVGALGADESPFLDAGDIRGGGAGEERVRALLGIQAGEGAVVAEELGEAVPFFLRSVAPNDMFRGAEGGRPINPCLQFFVGGSLCFHIGTIKAVRAPWRKDTRGKGGRCGAFPT